MCVGGREDLGVRGAPQKVLRTPLTSQTTIAASRPYTAIWSRAGSGLLAWLLAGGESRENDVFIPLSCIPLSSRRRSFISVVPDIISCTRGTGRFTAVGIRLLVTRPPAPGASRVYSAPLSSVPLARMCACVPRGASRNRGRRPRRTPRRRNSGSICHRRSPRRRNSRVVLVSAIDAAPSYKGLFTKGPLQSLTSRILHEHGDVPG